jgi:beta-glucanase (GH16 family)
VISVLPPPDPAGRVPFGQDPTSYTLTFAEEFTAGFDSRAWNDRIWYEESNPTKNYAVENGVLKIWPQRDGSGNFFNRTIDTDGKFAQTYGYFEMEARLPRGKGTWPAFWLFNHIGDRRPEMDIMEAYAGGEGWGQSDPSGVHIPIAYGATVWHGNGDEGPAGFRMVGAGVDLSAGFHKYAVKWEPGRQTYYFDGNEVLQIAVAIGDPMYILLDLWFGSASGNPDDATPQGRENAFEVNYVRAWKPAGS